MLIYQDDLSGSIGMQERFCYEGILCSELHQSQIPMVGYFYLTPRRYVMESILLCSVFSLILWKLHESSKTTFSQQSSRDSARPSRFLQVTCCLIIGLNIFFKSTPNSKLWFLCMPCNVQWILLLWYSCQPTHFYLFELICSYWSFCLPALLNPDTDDVVDNIGELEFFYLHHGLLLVLVPLLVLSRIHTTRHELTPSVSLKHHLRCISISACWFGLFYFGPVTLISLLTGWNLNYMLVPPPNQLLAVGGQYRLKSIGVCVGMMLLSRILLTGFATICASRRALSLFFSMSSSSSSSSASSHKAKET